MRRFFTGTAILGWILVYVIAASVHQSSIPIQSRPNSDGLLSSPDRVVVPAIFPDPRVVRTPFELMEEGMLIDSTSLHQRHQV